MTEDVRYKQPILPSHINRITPDDGEIIVGGEFEPVRRPISDFDNSAVFAQIDIDLSSKADSSSVTPLVTAQRGIYHIDNYANVQAALTAAGNAGGGTVTGTPGTTYAQTTTLTVPANVTLSGVALTFTGAPDSTSSSVVLAGENASVEGCTLSLLPGSTYRRAVSHRANRTVTRRNVILADALDLGTPVPGVYTGAFFAIFASMNDPQTMTGIVIEDNDISLTNLPYADGVQASRCPGMVVRGNRIHDSTFTSPYHADNFHFWGIYVAVDCPGALVEANTIENFAGGGIHFNNGTNEKRSLDGGRHIRANVIRNVAYIGLSVDYCTGTQVTGNHVSRCERHLNILDSLGTVVSGNTWGETEFDFGGVPQVAGTPTAVIAVNNSPRTIISTNTFAANTVVERSISVGLSPNTLIDANVFDPARPGAVIQVGSSAHGVVIARNVIPLTTRTTAGSAIAVTASDALIVDNTIDHPTTAGWIVMRIQGDRNSVRGNQVTGGQRVAYIAAGTGNEIDGNRATGTGLAPFDNQGTNTIIHHTGPGAPTVAAGIGSTWRRTDGAAGTTMYVNETGTSTWRAV